MRELPKLGMLIELYKDGAEAAGERPFVHVESNPAASHQRLVDVLNALSGAEITDVTLSGW